MIIVRLSHDYCTIIDDYWWLMTIIDEYWRLLIDYCRLLTFINDYWLIIDDYAYDYLRLYDNYVTIIYDYVTTY